MHGILRHWKNGNILLNKKKNIIHSYAHLNLILSTDNIISMFQKVSRLQSFNILRRGHESVLYNRDEYQCFLFVCLFFAFEYLC